MRKQSKVERDQKLDKQKQAHRSKETEPSSNGELEKGGAKPWTENRQLNVRPRVTV